MENQVNARDYRMMVFKAFLAFWFLVVIFGVYAGL